MPAPARFQFPTRLPARLPWPYQGVQRGKRFNRAIAWEERLAGHGDSASYGPRRWIDCNVEEGVDVRDAAGAIVTLDLRVELSVNPGGTSDDRWTLDDGQVLNRPAVATDVTGDYQVLTQ